MLESHQQSQSQVICNELKSTSLSSSEWDALKPLGLKRFFNDQIDSIETELLLNDEHCIAILHKITPKIGSANLKITASLVMKRMGFLTLASTMYAMSRFNVGLNVELANCIFEYPLMNKIWQSKMPLKDFTIQRYQTDRQAWRNRVISKVFAGNLTLMVNQFHKVTRVSKRILWENIAVRVFSIYEKRLLIGASPELLKQIQQDYFWLVNPTNTSIFGLDYNPLSEFYQAEFFSTSLIDLAPEPPNRIRKTCCYYYKSTEPTEYCGVCPRLQKPAN